MLLALAAVFVRHHTLDAGQQKLDGARTVTMRAVTTFSESTLCCSCVRLTPVVPPRAQLVEFQRSGHLIITSVSASSTPS
jgi:hypothetical protein